MKAGSCRWRSRGVCPVAGEQRQVPGGVPGKRARTSACWLAMIAGGGLSDRQPAVGAVVLGVGVDQHRFAVGVAGQAVQPQLADLVGPPPGVHHQLGHPAHVGAAAFLQQVQVGVEDLQHPGGRSRPCSSGSGSAGMSWRPMMKSSGRPAASPPGRVRPRARMSVRNRRASRQACTRMLGADRAGPLVMSQPVGEGDDVAAAEGRRVLTVVRAVSRRHADSWPTTLTMSWRLGCLAAAVLGSPPRPTVWRSPAARPD